MHPLFALSAALVKSMHTAERWLQQYIYRINTQIIKNAFNKKKKPK